MSVDYNPFDPATIEDPYPVYRELREAAAVHHLEAFGLWAVCRYDDVVAVLRDPKTFSSADGWGRIFMQVLGRDFIYGQGEGRNILAADPPVHTRIRKTVNRAFTPKMIQSWEPQVRAIVDEVLDEVEAKAEEGPVDIAADCFALFPVTVIAVILGVERERRAEFNQWTIDLLAGLSMFADAAKVEYASNALGEYLGPVVEHRREHPGDDIVSMLVTNGSDGEDPLSFHEMVGFATMLLLAGAETTSNMLSNWLAAVMARPELEAQLLADRSLVFPSIEELFRYDPVTQMVWRAPTEDVEIGGVAVPKGEVLAVMLGSSNRDETKWGPDAAEFRIGREIGGNNLVFGTGPHVCLGAHLARLEMRVMIEQLLDRFTSFRAAGPAVRSPNFMLRGLHSLPVQMDVKKKASASR